MMGHMPRILAVYGTTDGHTAAVVGRLAADLRSFDVEVCVARAGRRAPAPDDFDGILVAASIHAGTFQSEVERWIRRHAAALLRQRATGFLAICLAAADTSESGRAKLLTKIRRFLDACEWQPSTIKPVAGALLYTKYPWFKRWMMKRMVAKRGGDADTRRDYIYTDWTDLQAFASDFSRMVSHDGGSTGLKQLA